MRRTVQAYVLRLPVGYFDSTKSGILISRIMSDAEGIRNLVGTGLVQLVGGLVTGAIALGVLFYLNWRLTVFAILILGLFGGGMAYAFTKLRPLFRERGKINAEVTGRLGETLGGIRIVKAYRAERGERSEEHTSELQSQSNLVCRLLPEKKKIRSRCSLLPKTGWQAQSVQAQPLFELVYSISSVALTVPCTCARLRRVPCRDLENH